MPSDPDASAALPSHERPIDATPVHTAGLPDTPTRDRSIPAAAWVEAPLALRALDDARYLRRIGPWLLWRAGDARGPATYWTCLAERPDVQHTFELFDDGSGAGRGPTSEHERFRTWKEDLRDHPEPTG